MPAWFIDIESATEIDAKSNGTPPASRIAVQASRANSPSSALQGVTRPSVEATPTKGFFRSSSFNPNARRNARWGARSSPSTVTREGSIGMVFFVLCLFAFILGHNLFYIPAVPESQLLRAPRVRRLRSGIHDLLQARIGVETHPALRPRPHRVPHLLRRYGNAGEQHGSARFQLFSRNSCCVRKRFSHAAERNAGHARIGPHRADIVAPGKRLADDRARP